jgi:hypothetical protein
MTIELITPPRKAILAEGASFSFVADAAITAMLIEVGTETAYDGTAGGAQSGFTVTVDVVASGVEYSVKRDAGWVLSPLDIRVTETTSGTELVTEFNYELSGSNKFPLHRTPAVPSDFPKLRVSTSGDAPNQLIEDVEWIDVVTGTPPDGMDATSPIDTKMTFTALAATTDPDAIHDSTANEISPLTEKLTTNEAVDLLIMEDSAAGYVKKKVLAKAFAGAPIPALLEDDDNCQLLYDCPAGGFLNNTAANTSGLYTFTKISAGARMVMGSVQLARGMVFTGSSKRSMWSQAIGSEVTAEGDVTIQVVLKLQKEFTTGNTGVVFMCGNENSDTNRTCWQIGYYDDGSPAGTAKIVPQFRYRDPTNSTTISVRDETFQLSAGHLYHIAARRQGNGAGAYDASLWVNGLKIAESLAQVAGNALSTGGAVKIGADNGNDGVDWHQIYQAKMSNWPLTDGEIVAEAKKALGRI